MPKRTKIKSLEGRCKRCHRSVMNENAIDGFGHRCAKYEKNRLDIMSSERGLVTEHGEITLLELSIMFPTVSRETFRKAVWKLYSRGESDGKRGKLVDESALKDFEQNPDSDIKLIPPKDYTENKYKGKDSGGDLGIFSENKALDSSSKETEGEKPWGVARMTDVQRRYTAKNKDGKKVTSSEHKQPDFKNDEFAFDAVNKSKQDRSKKIHPKQPIVFTEAQAREIIKEISNNSDLISKKFKSDHEKALIKLAKANNIDLVSKEKGVGLHFTKKLLYDIYQKNEKKLEGKKKLILDQSFVKKININSDKAISNGIKKAIERINKENRRLKNNAPYISHKKTMKKIKASKKEKKETENVIYVNINDLLGKPRKDIPAIFRKIFE